MTEAVPSPCVSVCRMNAELGICEGCLRTIEEIAAWSVLDDATKLELWRELERRRWELEQAAPGARPPGGTSEAS